MGAGRLPGTALVRYLPGFRYGFGYDAFGNTTSASIAGTRVVSYTYEAKNGNISKAVYGNGHEIRYVYDSQDRLSASYFRASASSAEQKLNSYVYGKEGELYQVTDHVSGKTYDLDYDFLGRLMRVRDEKGSYYEYTYDANNHMTRMIHGAGASHVTAWYTYDKDGREQTTKIKSDRIKTTSYDKYGRSLGFSISTQDPFHVYLGYPEASGNREHALPNALSAGTTTLWYQYDQNGNIIRIGYNDYSSGTMASWADDFVYDERNQLIREDSQTQDKTFVYEYDEGGNLTAVKEYAYTKAAAPSAPVRTETGTYSSTWKDQLLGWNGVSMTYDAVGNMLTRGDISYTWTRGRKLSGVNNGKEIRYFYDHTGSRVKKVVDGVTTEYRMAGDLLVSEMADGQTVWYMYDSGANLVSMVSGGKNYFYIRNLQNDVIALIDEDGNEVVHYTYDSWGKILSITGSLKDTVGQQNPFRYRGYFYDTETGMYYLKSRYYDPELRRFISADGQINGGMLGSNLYIYCENDPVNRYDPFGNSFFSTILKTVEKVFSNLRPVYALAGGISQIDSPLPGPGDVIGGLISIGATVVGIASVIEQSIPEIHIDKVKIKESAPALSLPKPTRKQAYFPTNPYDFKPFGLERRVVVPVGGKPNGGIFIWAVPTQKYGYFEWDQDFRYGQHYHILLPIHKGKHVYNKHFRPGEAIPEPWNSLFFVY